MNITEFAEQIVFSNSLEEKLAPPGKLSFDRNPSAKLPSEKSLRAPGRPAHLLMQHEPGRNVQPPRDDQLEDERARGQLLHFLANHELLATELMALVLLKFPDAPRAFRQGILVTLQEEQQHTRMYLQRMRECGVEFGEWPVSGQFWRMVEPMKTPMDFVSRLSLTFEQANLDYSLHFASVFRKIGDQKTARLLEQIYEDEISHVQHGLEWFRQWKAPGTSDFDAWHANLSLPMSPARARGPRSSFNRDGRKRAGLSDEFIDAVEVFGQSKDRSAVLRWFEAAPEAKLANQHTGSLCQVYDDLEFVMLAFAKPDDVIWVRKLPSNQLRKHWLDVGIELPEFRETSCDLDDVKAFMARKLDRCEPWAWTPNNGLAVGSFRHPPLPWNESHRDLYRKSWGLDAVKRWLEDDGMPPWMGGSECAGIKVQKQATLSKALAELNRRGVETAVYKRDLSASGRGMHRIETADHRVSSLHKETSLAIVEPWQDRVVDLSFLWHVAVDGTPKFLGWTRPYVSKGGRYEGTALGSPFFDCEPEIRQFLLEDRCHKLHETVKWLEKHLLPELLAADFRGNFGVDAFVYRNAESGLKIRPFVELNPRTTMGHVALALEKRVASGVRAKFRILTRSEFDVERAALESIPFEKAKDRRWTSGVVWLNERGSNAKLIPCVVVGES
jgi:uncharacterized ferritin-like protein (DUF455 family)